MKLRNKSLNNHHKRLNAKTMSNAKQKSKTRMVIGKVRFSFVHVWEATSMNPGGPKKFSVSIIIPKSDTELVEKINAGIEAAKQDGISRVWKGKVPAKLKMPLRDGDVERPEDEAYKNSWFISANSNEQPGIVDANRQEILQQSSFYSGVYGRADVNFYPFDSNGSKGIACGLNHVQKLEDGEALSGRGSASDAFADEDDLAD